MTIKQAVIVLSNHQKWRKGDDKVPETDPKKLSNAIEIAIHILSGLK